LGSVVWCGSDNTLQQTLSLPDKKFSSLGGHDSVPVLQAMRTRCKNDRINNIGTEVPQCESSREQIGQGRIGTFAREGIGVGAKTAHGKRPATPEFSLGLGFTVTLGFRVRL